MQQYSSRGCSVIFSGKLDGGFLFFLVFYSIYDGGVICYCGRINRCYWFILVRIDRNGIRY